MTAGMTPPRKRQSALYEAHPRSELPGLSKRASPPRRQGASAALSAQREDGHMQDNYGDETKRAAAAETGGPDVPAVAKADTPTVPPGHKLVHPFAHYAAIEGGDAFFNGDYAKVDQEHGWVRGREKKPIGATEAFVAKMHEARHGHIKFAKSDGESVEHRTALIMDRPELPPCPACGNIADEHDDKRCDWRPAVYLPLRSVTDPSDVMCFTGNGLGARRALAQLCRIYARELADHQGKSRTILLEARSFKHAACGNSTS